MDNIKFRKSQFNSQEFDLATLENGESNSLVSLKDNDDNKKLSRNLFVVPALTIVW